MSHYPTLHNKFKINFIMNCHREIERHYIGSNSRPQSSAHLTVSISELTEGVYCETQICPPYKIMLTPYHYITVVRAK